MLRRDIKTFFNKLKELLSNEKFLFSILLILQISYFTWLTLTKRIPGGHDGFQYFALQYYFLNNTVHYQEIPQWMPFMTQGTVANWWYFVQAGLLQNILMLINGLLKSANFIPCFNAGMFVDELLLMVGSWLLAKRFLTSPLATFFCVSSIMSSCVWMSQPWYNFHLYYAIPLILHLGHRFLETKRWKFLLFLGTLFAIQMLGNLPYFLPICSFIIFSYFLLYCLFNQKLTTATILEIRNYKTGIFCFLAILLTFIGLYIILSSGTDQIINYNFGRKLDISNSKEGFLSYGENLNFNKWTELFIGISPAFDYILYGGIFIIPMIIIGAFFTPFSKIAHFTFLVLIILSISTASKLAEFLYFAWPLMKYYRHLALISPIAKLFLSFLAGFGIDIIISKQIFRKPLLILSATITVAVLLIIIDMQNNFSEHVDMMLSASNKLPHIELTTQPIFQIIRLERSLLISTVFIVLLGGSLLLNRRNLGFWGIFCLIVFHTWDVYSYKYNETNLRSLSLTDTQIKMMNFQPIPFKEFRETPTPGTNAKYDLLNQLPIPGQRYWSNSSFAFVDEAGSPFRVDHWLLALDNFMRSYWGQPIKDLTIKPQGLTYYTNLIFPLQHSAARKFAAVTCPKVQFFSDAHAINDPEIISSLISEKKYKGDTLFISEDTSHSYTSIPQYPNLNSSSENNKRLQIPFKIKYFSSNQLEIEVFTNTKKTWMVYSDVWHPKWEAFDNSQKLHIHRANLAYKAILLSPGQHKIIFNFFSPLLYFFQWFYCWLSLGWVLAVIYLTIQIYTPTKSSRKISLLT